MLELPVVLEMEDCCLDGSGVVHAGDLGEDLGDVVGHSGWGVLVAWVVACGYPGVFRSDDGSGVVESLRDGVGEEGMFFEGGGTLKQVVKVSILDAVDGGVEDPFPWFSCDDVQDVGGVAEGIDVVVGVVDAEMGSAAGVELEVREICYFPRDEMEAEELLEGDGVFENLVVGYEVEETCAVPFVLVSLGSW